MKSEPKYKLGDIVIYIGERITNNEYHYWQGQVQGAHLGESGWWSYKIWDEWVREQDITKKI